MTDTSSPGASAQATPKIVLRRATPEDGVAVTRLIDISNFGGDAHNFDAALANVLDPSADVGYPNVIVYERDGAVVGAAVLNLTVTEPIADLSVIDEEHRPFEALKALVPASIYLRNIAVFPEFEGQGVAHALVTTTLKFAGIMKAKGVCAIVRHDNERMRVLMQRHGLKVIASDALTRHATLPVGTRIDLWNVPV